MPDCGHPAPHYTWVDESNHAITESAAKFPLCRDCYLTRYGTLPRDLRQPRPDDFDHMHRGVLGVHNLLSSGDFEHRETARARFLIVSATPEGNKE